MLYKHHLKRLASVDEMVTNHALSRGYALRIASGVARARSAYHLGMTVHSVAGRPGFRTTATALGHARAHAARRPQECSSTKQIDLIW